MMVADEIQERELSDYITAYENLLDSLETPDNESFANVFLFLDEDFRPYANPFSAPIFFWEETHDCMETSILSKI